MTKTTYIISGYARSGTTMMIEAGEAGGLSAFYADSGPRWENREVPDELLEREDFIQLPELEGKLVKVFYTNLPKKFPTDRDWKICFMLRDPSEIRASLAKFKRASTLIEAGWYLDVMIEAYNRARERLGEENVALLTYRNVVKNPIEAFSKLRIWHKWPIDIQKAAAVVDPELYHCRKENKEESIND